MAAGFGLWVTNQLGWTLFEVVVCHPLPDPFFGDALLFLHVVPFMAAVTLRPHRTPQDKSGSFGGLNTLDRTGMTFAEYARRGFFELLAVACLALGMLCTLAVATRRKIYDMLVADRMVVQGFHYPFPGLAHVENDGSAYRVVPMPWAPTI